MKLYKLYLLNCGVFKNYVINFTDQEHPQDFLCLSGVNGSGKTTLIDIILNLISFLNPKLSLQDILFSRLRPNILTYTEFAQLDLWIDGKILSIILGDDANKQVYQDKKQAFYIITSEIIAWIKKFENEFVKNPQNETNIDLRSENSKDPKNFIIRIIDEDGITSQIKKENIELFEDFFTKISDHIYKRVENYPMSNLPLIYSFAAGDREILDIRYSSIPKDDVQYKVVQKYQPIKDDLNKLLVYYDYAYTEQFKKLCSWINENVLENKEVKRIDRPQFKTMIATQTGQEHSIELLSSGEANFLIIAIQLYLKTSSQSIILIDEIDQSLHPEYQEKIMKVIYKIQKERGFQIVVSSHSRFIWNTFEEKSIIRLTEVIKS